MKLKDVQKVAITITKNGKTATIGMGVSQGTLQEFENEISSNDRVFLPKVTEAVIGGIIAYCTTPAHGVGRVTAAALTGIATGYGARVGANHYVWSCCDGALCNT